MDTAVLKNIHKKSCSPYRLAEILIGYINLINIIPTPSCYYVKNIFYSFSKIIVVVVASEHKVKFGPAISEFMEQT